MRKILNSLLYIFTSALLFVSSSFINIYAASEGNLTMEKMDNWLKGYEQAWENLDAEKAGMLFTEDASYQENPYKDPFKGRAEIQNYWSTVTADQSNVDFTYEILSITGNTGIAHWHSEFIQPSTGSTIILDGIFVLEFSTDELCQSLKEWWHFQSIPAEK